MKFGIICGVWDTRQSTGISLTPTHSSQSSQVPLPPGRGSRYGPHSAAKQRRGQTSEAPSFSNKSQNCLPPHMYQRDTLRSHSPLVGSFDPACPTSLGQMAQGLALAFSAEESTAIHWPSSISSSIPVPDPIGPSSKKFPYKKSCEIQGLSSPLDRNGGIVYCLKKSQKYGTMKIVPPPPLPRSTSCEGRRQNDTTIDIG